MKKLKNDKAITLIALVVTIIILLILAGVTMGFAMNGTGLFEKAKLATDEYNNKVDEENSELEKTTNEIDKYVDGNREMVTISEEEYQMLKNANSYSTEEKRIGTWIDGKPLYQKVVKVNVSQSADTWVTIFNITSVVGENIDYFNVSEVYSTSGEQLSTDYWQKSGSNMVSWRRTYPKVIGQLTLKYTKTSDPLPTI